MASNAGAGSVFARCHMTPSALRPLRAGGTCVIRGCVPKAVYTEASLQQVSKTLKGLDGS